MPIEKPKDEFTRNVEMAFELECPGATNHDRLHYLQELLKKHGLALVSVEK